MGIFLYIFHFDLREYLSFGLINLGLNDLRLFKFLSL